MNCSYRMYKKCLPVISALCLVSIVPVVTHLYHEEILISRWYVTLCFSSSLFVQKIKLPNNFCSHETIFILEFISVSGRWYLFQNSFLFPGVDIYTGTRNLDVDTSSWQRRTRKLCQRHREVHSRGSDIPHYVWQWKQRVGCIRNGWTSSGDLCSGNWVNYTWDLLPGNLNELEDLLSGN